MTETLLITLDDIKAIKQISQNINAVERLQPYIQEAQLFDVKGKLGPLFYHDMIKNVSDQKYQELLNGITYTDNATPSNEYHFIGIKTAIAYYAYARYILNGQVTATGFSVVRKTNEFSEPVEDKTLVRLSTQARMAADALMDDCRDFLDIKYQTYTKWNTGACAPAKTTGATFYGIDNFS